MQNCNTNSLINKMVEATFIIVTLIGYNVLWKLVNRWIEETWEWHSHDYDLIFDNGGHY